MFMMKFVVEVCIFVWIQPIVNRHNRSTFGLPTSQFENTVHFLGDYHHQIPRYDPKWDLRDSIHSVLGPRTFARRSASNSENQVKGLRAYMLILKCRSIRTLILVSRFIFQT